MSSINWDELLNSKFVKIENDKPKKLLLANWRPQTEFKNDDGTVKAGILFDVLEEDGTKFEGDDIKTYTMTAIKGMAKMKPIIEKAELEKRDTIKVSIVRTGQGKQTAYSISEG